MDPVLFAFLLTALAGLATVLGSLITFLAPAANSRFLAFCLSFAAGVMIYVSFLEILPEAQELTAGVLGARSGGALTALVFFTVMLLFCLLDRAVPDEHNPHELAPADPCSTPQAGGRNLLRAGLFTGLAVALHNFLEGLATFVSALQQPSVAILIALAVAIHNVPIGISISAPIYFATRSKAKALVYTLFVGLTELFGALLGYWLLLPYLNDLVFGLLFAATAGIMVYLAWEELWPAARACNAPKLPILGAISGMAVMAVSMLFL